MGCPAYREGDPTLSTLPNGVARMLIRAAATIYDYESENGGIVGSAMKRIWHTHMHLGYVNRYSDLSPIPLSLVRMFGMLMSR